MQHTDHNLHCVKSTHHENDIIPKDNHPYGIKPRDNPRPKKRKRKESLLAESDAQDIASTIINTNILQNTEKRETNYPIYAHIECEVRNTE